MLKILFKFTLLFHSAIFIVNKKRDFDKDDWNPALGVQSVG